MDAARLLETLNHQGLTMIARGAQLIVKPGNLLTANDETLILEHKPELLRLLRAMDVETLLHALTVAGPAGLDWREGTPADWPNDRLLDAGEALYADGRMVNVLGRRYLALEAPRLPDQWSDTTSPQTTPQIESSTATSGLAIDPPPAPAADDRMDPLHREDADNPQAARIAGLVERINSAYDRIAP